MPQPGGRCIEAAFSIFFVLMFGAFRCQLKRSSGYVIRHLKERQRATHGGAKAFSNSKPTRRAGESILKDAGSAVIHGRQVL